MKTMDEKVKQMKLAHLLSSFPLKLRNPFCTSTFTSSNFLIAFFDVHTTEKEHLSLMYMYVKASNNTPSYTYVNLYVNSFT